MERQAPRKRWSQAKCCGALVHRAVTLGAVTLTSALHTGQELQQLKECHRHIHGPFKTFPIKTHIKKECVGCVSSNKDDCIYYHHKAKVKCILA